MNLFADTLFNMPYPPYISINQEGQKITVTVRGPARKKKLAHGEYDDIGHTVTFDMTKDKLLETLALVKARLV